MSTASSTYLGQLRVKSEHTRSGVHITTDAPLDNRGRGESFSPTDLTCVSLVSCMLTIVGIWAMDEELHLEGMQAIVTKHMADNPRRIASIDVVLKLPNAHGLDNKQLTILRRKAETCPVAKSLHPDIALNLSLID